MSEDYPSDSLHAPLFIVGMHRSGTKLLRELLRNHSKIFLTTAETELLPVWDGWIRRHGPPESPAKFRRFFEDQRDLPFFHFLKSDGLKLGEGEWYGACPDFSLAGLFYGLVLANVNARQRSLTGADPKDRFLAGEIWGDKSPNYRYHLPLIKKIFPEARVLLIVRDPRDYALSVRNGWGKSLTRAVYRWRMDMGRLLEELPRSGLAYHIIRYEDLLNHPVGVLRECCGFLSLEFESGMDLLDRTVEKIGDTRGAKSIQRANQFKFRERLKPRQIRRLEEISWPVLKYFGYRVELATREKKLSTPTRAFFFLYDVMALVRRQAGLTGLRAALAHYWGQARQR